MSILGRRCLLTCALGFSLVELLLVIFIAVALLGLGIPAFQSFVQGQRLTAVANDFFSAVLLARAEAIRTGGRVDLGATDGMNWKNGWMIFINRSNDLDPTYNTGDELIFSHPAIGDEIVVSSNFTDSSFAYIAYNGAGRSRTNAGNQSPQLGTISFSYGEQTRRIKLNFMGRPRVCNPAVEPAICTGS